MSHLEELEQPADEGIDVQLADCQIAHGVRALPLSAALRHCQEGVQVEARQPRHANKSAQVRCPHDCV